MESVNWSKISLQDRFWLFAILFTISISISFAMYQGFQMVRDSFFPRRATRPPPPPGADKKLSEGAEVKKIGEGADKGKSSGVVGQVQDQLRETRSRGAAGGRKK